MSTTATTAGFSICAHIRRLSAAGSVLYIRLDNADISRTRLKHGQTIEMDLGRVPVVGVVKTSGGSPWLAPSRGGSNAAITAALRRVGFEHGVDIQATGRILAPEYPLPNPVHASAGATLTPVIRSPRAFLPPNQDGASDHSKVVAALRHRAQSICPSSDRAWRREPAVRVVDCILSLNRRYDSFVVPRLDCFEQTQSDVRTVSDLHGLMKRYPSSDAFVTQVLDYRHSERAATLWSVVKWLVTVSGTGASAEQLANLQNWAVRAQPSDYTALRIRGFGLAGFQYLRMLFGANTTKPDIHIRRFVEACVGHPVSDIYALQLLERAATELGIALRDLDTTIWEESAR
jgi:hypothetical protein